MSLLLIYNNIQVNSILVFYDQKCDCARTEVKRVDGELKVKPVLQTPEYENKGIYCFDNLLSTIRRYRKASCLLAPLK